ncbi:related to tRNA 2`-phosphotransferase [Cephalotrichum gorgonifer]|uniref:2'-phosphotransferase n=1 Tax=Cephalotrichum gorgonifer TaxID=2041049 RepID=A0AAE8MWA6_9PEZI|nr:related to tRNA 2`-phosphotransferase [Cephalotrichum gorgonifer]
MADTGLEDRAHAQADRGRKGRGGRGGRGGGGGGAMGREVLVSKALSRLLRHQAENAGLKLDEGGYTELDKVMAWQPIRSLNVTFADIQTAVSDNAKQRFSMKPNPATNPSLSESSTDPSHYLIRANQGHSIAVANEGLLTPVTLEAANVPAEVVHGTYFCFWDAIVASGGLKVMGRNHVHCSTGLPGEVGGVISGMRRDAELLVYIDVERSLKDGALQWWLSDNGVVLTEGDAEGLVPLKYFREVRGRTVDVGVLVKDGELVGELPEGIKKVVREGRGVRGEGVEEAGAEVGASSGVWLLALLA